MVREALLHKAELLFGNMSKQTDMWKLNMNYWDWNAGVALYALTKLYEVTGDGRLRQYMKDWLVRNAPNRKSGSVNAVAPAQAALLLARLDGDEEAQALCGEYADWCLNRALRTGNGGLAHVWNGGLEDYRNQLWIDTLFMAGLFMLQYGLEYKDEALVEEALWQFDIHIDCQFDRSSGLFYHGYHCVREVPLGQHWGRGNGWAAASLADLMEALQDTGRSLEPYAGVYRRLMASALTHAEENGMLRTLLDDPTAYVETTATALFVYAALKGIRLGLLDASHGGWANRAASTVLDLIGDDGSLRLTSGGTDCQEREGYLAVPYAETQYAYGTVILMISEQLRVGGGEGAAHAHP